MKTNKSDNKTTIIKFEQPAVQTVGDICRVVGFVKAKSYIGIIDSLDLQANPRSSKVGAVTHSIAESMDATPAQFPFKTKGVLLGASSYEALDRGRYRVVFDDVEIEGILDGGHNTLAIGMYILEKACAYAGVKFPKGVSTWSDFKGAWRDLRSLVAEYQEAMRKEEDDTATRTPLDVLVPTELILPSDPENTLIVDSFESSLLDICAARNNNVQLSVSTKANKRGYFDSLKKVIAECDPTLAARIEWKTNDGGDIEAEDIIALAWIPLSLIDPVHDEDGKLIDAPSPTHLYSGKGSGLAKFERLMSSDEVTTQPSGNYQRELANRTVLSAFQITAQLPALYDHIFEVFPDLYNEAGGKYGRIDAVKALNAQRKNKETPFGGKAVEVLSPEGFIAPLVYGLRALMELRGEDGYAVVCWSVDDPMAWLDEHLAGIVKRYRNVLLPWSFDPQKVGKTVGSYESALDAYKMALVGLD